MYSKIKQLFQRYQSGKASPAEHKIVEDWFEEFNDRQQEPIDEEQKTMLFGPMDRKIQAMLYPRKSYVWLKAAAAVLLALSATLVIHHINSASSPLIAYQVIKVPNGIKEEITLPDSSVIYLNSGSSVSIPSDFGNKKREISFTGEAFFIIKHNPNKPFTLHAGKLLIADIGTSFDVKAYPEDRQISVAVETGSVAVEKKTAAGKSTVLTGSMTQNQQLIYNKANDTHTLGKIPSANIASWHNNQLRFDNASFAEIASQLERWYNVSVKLSDPEVQGRRYTISFDDEPVDHVLDVLARLSGATYQINHQNIVIHLKNAKNMK
ncbi:FecR family protein [Mucilaginibacter mallensis]|uniref:FecR family protein n=1 Tax=Mucilaginibacter mallensis TaxID=652787 RepID=A0A1H2BH21_MUCMA|nr:FecR domain-containing protein [Mucilaginibacter mallensis]SDT57444.1 FecR family protein [Mucilaginibacter mallensis]